MSKALSSEGETLHFAEGLGEQKITDSLPKPEIPRKCRLQIASFTLP